MQIIAAYGSDPGYKELIFYRLTFYQTSSFALNLYSKISQASCCINSLAFTLHSVAGLTAYLGTNHQINISQFFRPVFFE